MKKILPNSENVRIYGRTNTFGDTLQLIMSASGCGFTFSGKKLEITLGCDEDSFNENKLCNFPRAALLVNGRIVLKRVITEKSFTFTAIDSPEPVSAEIRLIKLSEAAFSVLELASIGTDDSAEVAPLAEKSLKIEFIGDSITCGYGVDDSNTESEFSTAVENAMKSYAYLTAKALDADYSMFSASGYGIISGYTKDGNRNTLELIPPYYESLGFSYKRIEGEKRPHDIPWDFSSFVPDIVAINLGTNDGSFCHDSNERKAEFVAAYEDFLRTVRRCNPAAELLCLFGIMDTEMTDCVREAYENYKKNSGDEHVKFLKLRAHDGNLGYSSNWHPSEDTHSLEAEILADFIRNNY